MAKTVNYSLSAFKLGDISADGTMGTSLTQFDDPVRDTAVLTMADGTTTTFDAEISDMPYSQVTEPGAITFAADLYAKSAAQLEKCFGGTVVAASGTTPESWEYPVSQVTIEQSVELVHKNGAKIQIPRCSLNCTFEWNFKRNALPLIHFSGTVLQPIDTDGNPLTTIGSIKYIGAPTA